MKEAMILIYMIGFSSAVIYRLNDTDYDRMPALIQLDPYERCLREPEGVYCSGYINFVSDEPSPLFTQMKEYSGYTNKHFNYTIAFYGTCVSDKCSFETEKEPKHSLEACLNRTVWNEYQLRVKIEEELYCVGGSNRKKPLDMAEIAMMAVCLILLLLNIIGSLYDFHISGREHGSVAYFLLCFSLHRNWKSLVSSSDNSRGPRDSRLQGLDGLRAISMVLVVQAHIAMSIVIGSSNQKFFENLYECLPFYILLNITLTMQTFLILSAFLLVYTSLKAEDKHETSWTSLPVKIVKRWLRLTPAYALVLGVTATWLDYIGEGPFWGLAVTAESRDCRRDWWRYPLYINNYYDDSTCMIQAWYLAADFQLYCLGVIIYVFCKSQTSRKVVLSVLFMFGLVIPGLHTYFEDLDPIVIGRPDSIRTLFTTDLTFHHVYKRAHNNIPGYVMGLALGYLIYRLQQNGFDEKKYQKWRPVIWAMVPTLFGLLLVCKVFYAEGPRMDVYWRAVIACFIRPIFGLTVAVIVAGTILKIENVCKGVLEWRGWTTLAKVSYSAYLIHIAMIKTLGGGQTTPLTGNFMSIIPASLTLMLVIYVAAYVFYLTVLAPFDKLVNIVLGQRQARIIHNQPVLMSLTAHIAAP